MSAASSAGPRAVLFFSSMYALVDMSLELSTGEARTKRGWHHVLASSFAGGAQAAAAGLNAAKGGLLGLALGLVSAPVYVYAFTDGKAPSLLAIVAPRRGGGGGGEVPSPSPSTTTIPLSTSPHASASSAAAAADPQSTLAPPSSSPAPKPLS